MFIGKPLAKLREARGITQLALTNELGLKGSNTLSNLERNMREPDLDTAVLIARFFGVHVEDLRDDEKEEEGRPPGGATRKIEHDSVTALLVQEGVDASDLPAIRSEVLAGFKGVSTDLIKRQARIWRRCKELRDGRKLAAPHEKAAKLATRAANEDADADSELLHYPRPK